MSTVAHVTTTVTTRVTHREHVPRIPASINVMVVALDGNELHTQRPRIAHDAYRTVTTSWDLGCAARGTRIDVLYVTPHAADGPGYERVMSELTPSVIASQGTIIQL